MGIDYRWELPPRRRRRRRWRWNRRKKRSCASSSSSSVRERSLFKKKRKEKETKKKSRVLLNGRHFCSFFLLLESDIIKKIEKKWKSTIDHHYETAAVRAPTHTHTHSLNCIDINVINVNQRSSSRVHHLKRHWMELNRSRPPLFFVSSTTARGGVVFRKCEKKN